MIHRADKYFKNGSQALFESCWIVVILSIFFVLCSSEIDSRKIILTENTEEQIDQPETRQIPPAQTSFAEKYAERNKLTILVLPAANNTNLREFENIEHDVTDIVVYFLDRNPEFRIIPAMHLSEKYDVDNNDFSAKVINRMIKEEGINYYINSSLERTSAGFGLQFTLSDALSGATLTEKTIIPQNPGEEIYLIGSAVKTINTILAFEPYDPNEYFNTKFNTMRIFVQGLDAEYNYDLERAKDLYIRCIQEDAVFAQAYFQLVSLYFNYFSDVYFLYVPQYLEQAERHLDRLSEQEKMLMAAYRNFNFQKFNEALSSFGSHSNKYPDRIYGYIGQAKTFLALDKPESALELLSPLIDTFPKNILLFYVQSKAYRQLGNYDESIQLINYIKSALPGNSYPLLEKAKILISWGRIAEGESLFEELVHKDEKNVQALALLTELYFSQMNFSRCIEIYEQASPVLSADRTTYIPDIYYYLFLSYVYTGQFSAASDIAKKLIEGESQSDNLTYSAWLSSYVVLLDQIVDNERGMMEMVHSIFSEKMGESAQTNPYKYDVLSKLSEGIGSFLTKDYSNAVFHLNTVQEYEYSSLAAYYISKAYIEEGDLKNAREQVELFYENLDLEEFESAFILPFFYIIEAELLEKDNQIEAARNLYNTFLKLWGNADDQFFPLQIVKEKLAHLN